MTATLHGEVPLFDALAPGHIVTVAPHTETVTFSGRHTVLTWHTWHCTCGQASTDTGNRWSHHDLAARMGQHHANRTTNPNGT